MNVVYDYKFNVIHIPLLQRVQAQCTVEEINSRYSLVNKFVSKNKVDDYECLTTDNLLHVSKT